MLFYVLGMICYLRFGVVVELFCHLEMVHLNSQAQVFVFLAEKVITD